MPDVIFENERLVAIYDHFDGERRDLCHYLAIARELGAKSILDIGCGTGCFACLLSEHGFRVTGLEPARASLDIARRKPFAGKVNWINGDMSTISDVSADLAFMTGNVAQVFITDELWLETLSQIRKVLNERGHLVFEVRDPSQKAWLCWNRENTYQKLDIPEIGEVEGWCEVTEVAQQLVSFRWTYVFASDGKVITSDSTLRFRERAEIEQDLIKSGFVIREIRDAPDRPGKEFVFIASIAKD